MSRIRLDDIILSNVVRNAFFFAIGALAASILIPAAGNSRFRASLVYTETSRFDFDAWVHGGERFPDGAQLQIFSDNKSKPLVAGFFATADPEVSFDARRILFAGKKRREDHWQIWEMALAGGPPKRVTHCDEDCIRPLYFAGSKAVYARKREGSYQLEALAPESTEATRLTYARGSYLPLQILRDGRILFEGPYPIGGSGPVELYAVYTDGSGMEAIRCDHGKARRGAHQLASGDLVFATGMGLGKFTPALARQIDLVPPVGEVAGPIAEVAPGRWLISLRPRAGERFGLYEWSPGNKASPVRLLASEANVIQPVEVIVRTTPPRHPSGLHNRPGANLLCLNSYESPLRFAEGSIGAVRVYAQDAAGKPVLLGQASVETDGSFFVQVPTEQPIRIELADRSGRFLAGEKGWFWMRRGEQRICVGCHAGPERAPENAVPKILGRPGVPVQMTEDRGAR